MQKRSFLTVICFLLITNAFAHELDDIDLTDESDPPSPPDNTEDLIPEPEVNTDEPDLIPSKPE